MEISIEKMTVTGRYMRLAVVKNQLSAGNITEDDALELLRGPLDPDDESTIIDDSEMLHLSDAEIRHIFGLKPSVTSHALHEPEMPKPPLFLRVSRDANIIFPFSQAAMVAYLDAREWELIRDDADGPYQVYRGGQREKRAVWIVKDSYLKDDSKDIRYGDYLNTMITAIRNIQMADGVWTLDLLGDIQMDKPIERPDMEFDYVLRDAGQCIDLPWNEAPDYANYGTVNAGGQITWWYSKPIVPYGSLVWELDTANLDPDIMEGGWSRYGSYIELPIGVDWRTVIQKRPE